MGKTFDTIDERLREFLAAQRMFFVATAPLAADGHLNLSPKGYDTFRILDEKTVAYLDLTGSGVETIAHLRETGRITFLFCAFDGPPRLVRLYGRGEILVEGEPEHERLRPLFPELPGARSIVRVRLERIADSCGYGVPTYRFEEQRSQLLDWADRKGPEAVVRYRAENNRESIDGLPGLGLRPTP